MQERYIIVAILHSYAVSQGGRDLQPIYEASRPLLWSMRNCGKARLRGTPVGDTPICVGFQGCAAEEVGSRRRDLVKPLCHDSDFRVPGKSTSSTWQTQLSIAGGLVMKQEMNEYFTFDRR
jgi:hypothetical protein